MKLNQYEWDPDKDLIAEGAFALVFRARDTNTAERFVALKIYKEAVAQGTTSGASQKKYTLEKEFGQIDGISHTNIITYYGINYIKHADAFGRPTSYPVIIMEFAAEGTLADFLKNKPSEDDITKVIKDMIKGVEYLHSEGILHRDLKPGNILITRNRKGQPVAKITDFGISRDLLSEQTIEESLTAGVGTPHYMAPEQFFKKKYGLNQEISEKTDYWGIGVIVYRILTGKLPFGHGSRDYEHIRDAIINDSADLSQLPEKYRGLVQNCLVKVAAGRELSFDEMASVREAADTILDSIEQVGQEKPTLLVNEATTTAAEEETAIGNGLDEAGETPTVTNADENSLKTITDDTQQGNQNNKEELTNELENKKHLAALTEEPEKKLAPIEVMASFCFLVSAAMGIYIISIGAEFGFSLFGLIYVLSSLALFISTISGRRLARALDIAAYGTVTFFSVFVVAYGLWFAFEGDEVNEGRYIAIPIALANLFVIFKAFFLRYGLKIGLILRARKGITNLAIFGFIVLYLVSWFGSAMDDTSGTEGVTLLLLGQGAQELLLLPNLFFFMAVFYALIRADESNDFRLMLILLLLGLFTMSTWWLFLDEKYGYVSRIYAGLAEYSRDGYVQNLGWGYYAWFTAIFGFMSIVLFEGAKWLKRLQSFRLVWFGAVIATLSLFVFQYQKSLPGYLFYQAVDEVNHAQLMRAFEKGAQLSWYSRAADRVLDQYSASNASQATTMISSLIDKGATLSSSNADDLERVIQQGGAELITTLLQTSVKDHINDKDLLTVAAEADNVQIMEQLFTAGAVSNRMSRVQGAVKSKEMHSFLLQRGFDTYSFTDQFGTGRTHLSHVSNSNHTWRTTGRTLVLEVKTPNKSFVKGSVFPVDPAASYSLEVEVSQNKPGFARGLYFDGSGSNRHTVTLVNDKLRLHRYEESKWSLVKAVTVVPDEGYNVLKVLKSGNLVNCYLNGKRVMINERINSFEGQKMGVAVSRSADPGLVFFRNFKLVGKWQFP